MIKENPIPLDKKVQVREYKIPELLDKVQEEGVELPRREERPRLGVMDIEEIANKPVGTSLEAYQISQGNYGGRILQAQHREEAYSVRRQFGDFLEEVADREAE